MRGMQAAHIMIPIVVACVIRGEEILNIDGHELVHPTQFEDGPVGTLACETTQAHYQLSDQEGAVVESVMIGLDPEASECWAHRSPPTSVPAVPDSYVIVVNYSQCNFTHILDVVAGSTFITYTTTARVTVRYATLAPGISRRKRFELVLSCRRPWTVQVSLSWTWEYPTIGAFNLASFSSHLFPGLISARLRSKLVPIFGKDYDVTIYSMVVELDKSARDTYELLGVRCWATPNANASYHVRYEYLSPQGCNELGRNFLQVTPTETYKIIYDVADFEFADQDSDQPHFFHCDINICLKGQNDPRCKVSGCTN